jgi:hypothetical protein
MRLPFADQVKLHCSLSPFFAAASLLLGTSQQSIVSPADSGAVHFPLVEGVTGVKG